MSRSTRQMAPAPKEPKAPNKPASSGASSRPSAVPGPTSNAGEPMMQTQQIMALGNALAPGVQTPAAVAPGSSGGGNTLGKAMSYLNRPGK